MESPLALRTRHAATSPVAAMQSAVARAYGPPEVIRCETVAVPTPAADQLLVRVHATTVNPADCKQRSGNLQLVLSHQFPVAFCQDFAGVVEAAPASCAFKVGDAVYGSTAPRNGCAAELIAVYEHECALKPASLDWDAAAATPTAACTAYRGVVSLGKARSGMRVLIHGASGGVGSAMAQIATALGCRVVGTCGPHNVSYLRSLGVTPLDHGTPLGESLRGSADAPFDLILDAVGGDHLYEASHPLLSRGGKYITAVGPVMHGGSDPITVRTLLATASTLVPRLLCSSTYRIYLSFSASDLREEALAALIASGKLTVRVDPQRYDLSSLAEAHAKCETHRSDGRIVVRVASKR